MEFAEQERRPEQVVTPEYQSFSPEGSEESRFPPGSGVNYSKVPKAFQKSHFFGMPSVPSQEKAQGQPNTSAPVAKASGNSDSASLGGAGAPPILIAGGLGGALPAPRPNPLQRAVETFGKGAAAVGRGAAGLGLGELAIPLAGAAALIGGPLAQPVNNEETDWMRKNAARQQVLRSQHGRGNKGDSGIQREARELIQNGEAENTKQALEILMRRARQANDGQGDPQRKKRIETTQKAERDRHSREVKDKSKKKKDS
jgi:hypothetical protein